MALVLQLTILCWISIVDLSSVFNITTLLYNIIILQYNAVMPQFSVFQIKYENFIIWNFTNYIPKLKKYLSN